ncbi:isopentenyl-diphosphate Delta-isomerase [Anaeromicropila herbilytica]|uniref:Isopentenyl-diphosphate delta-isomerase n=1 Tax=Anaeromicropila herbilytica TaxID=2785025 RepID=A0A7R7EHJ6_9FIRM|nr:isopentenyl-diphosphate Delta-isomerase [Anaeromicropila herbilytica]BCN29350.1 isopentenyl-diphosphate Delta-isomerase [Anaeromicropila herbilytica]
MTEYIIEVNQEDQELGQVEKMEAHRKGILHRAFSIFIFNSKNQLLLQKRNTNKYHSGGLWTNTCCSHPRVGEKLEDAVDRRLMEEMGFHCELSERFSFTYQVQLDHNLMEHEYDHVFIGRYEGNVLPDENEVEAYKWVDILELSEDLKANPHLYTFWFRSIYDKVMEHITLD